MKDQANIEFWQNGVRLATFLRREDAVEFLRCWEGHRAYQTNLLIDLPLPTGKEAAPCSAPPDTTNPSRKT